MNMINVDLFLNKQYEKVIKPEFLKLNLPQLQIADLIPQKTGIHYTDTRVEFYFIKNIGIAERSSDDATEFPKVSHEMTPISMQMAQFHIGATWTAARAEREQKIYQKTGAGNFIGEYTTLIRDRLFDIIDKSMLYGGKAPEISRGSDITVNNADDIYGLYNHPSIQNISVDATGTGSGIEPKKWKNKTGENIVKDILNAIDKMIGDTRGYFTESSPFVLVLPRTILRVLEKRYDLTTFNERTILDVIKTRIPEIRVIDDSWLLPADRTKGILFIKDKIVLQTPVPNNQLQINPPVKEKIENYYLYGKIYGGGIGILFQQGIIRLTDIA